MFVESLEELHESMHEHMVEGELDGKKGFIHKSDVPLINSLKNAKKEKEELRGEYNSINERLTSFEESKAKEIEDAKKEALEQAKTKGDVTEIEKRYQEQMADLEKRTEQKVREQMSSEFALSTAKAKAGAEISDIVSKLKPLDDDAADALKTIVQARQQVSDDAKILYSNTDGSASVMGVDELVKELAAKPSIQRLIQNNLTTTGGGLVKGSHGQNHVAVPQNKAAEDAKSKKDLNGFLAATLQYRT